MIEAQGIKIYQPPIEEDDEHAAAHARSLMAAMPFSVIGSEKDVKTNDGRVVKGRQYIWGVAEVENEDHCDFKKLRSILIRTHMLDLIHTTEEQHYEAYRAGQMETRKFGEARPRKLDNPKFKEEEEALRKRFTEQVKIEEQRFRQWEQKLIAERDRLNKDLESTHAAYVEGRPRLNRLHADVRQDQTTGAGTRADASLDRSQPRSSLSWESADWSWIWWDLSLGTIMYSTRLFILITRYPRPHSYGREPPKLLGDLRIASLIGHCGDGWFRFSYLPLVASDGFSTSLIITHFVYCSVAMQTLILLSIDHYSSTAELDTPDLALERWSLVASLTNRCPCDGGPWRRCFQMTMELNVLAHVLLNGHSRFENELHS